jgi:hypothetical protein
VRIFRPVLRVWRDLGERRAVESAVVTRARQQALWLPLGVVALSCLGWLPGGLLFPLGIARFGAGEPLGTGVFAHFMVSFWLSGAIALTYSFFGTQYVALRILYARLSFDSQDLRQLAQKELAPIEARMRRFQAVAGAIPLGSAALLLAFGPESSPRGFRLLIVALIVCGMAGFGLAVAITRRLSQTMLALRGTDRAE